MDVPAPTQYPTPVAGPAATPDTGFPLKRLLLGRAIPTERLQHERLGRPTALAVFSSDNMSSVAYASEEILRVLIPTVGIAAFTLVLPISAVIVLIEAVLIFSYRQTIKAYPSAGGAYIVTKDNLGLIPAQVAGVALLVDYVLTVSVSTAAGVQAVSTVVDLAVPERITLSLLFVWMIAYGNLLGVRESGRIFALPTYLFIGSLYLTIMVGLVQVLTGHVQPIPVSEQMKDGGLPLGTSAVALFIVLKAFASGGAAVTGVEAISNGVPAFRKPEWRNAQTTLMWMGGILGVSFLAISYLAEKLQVVPVADESKSVLGQIGQIVYGSGPAGHSLFLLLQMSTTLILVLAANTSFADFPRLASFHAGDSFMPRQLTKRGHRLVFSNGVIGLAVAASLVIVVFQASVTRMIPLYALGVFTSFTLSQAGMARRHLRLREKGWKLGLSINGAGAVSTFLVAIIIAVVKFSKGAWIVVILVPLLVFILTRVNRTYEAEDADLMEGLARIRRPLPMRHLGILVVEAVDSKTLHALRYGLTIRPGALRAIHLDADGSGEIVRREWEARVARVELEVVRCTRADRAECLAEYVRPLVDGSHQVTVVLPGPSKLDAWQRLRVGRSWRGLVERIRDLPDVSLAVVRDRPGEGGPDQPDVPLAYAGHQVVILVEQLDRSILKGLRYGRSVDASDIRAVHAAADPHAAELLADAWAENGHLLGVPLDVEACFDRNVVASITASVERALAPGTLTTVVLPRREYPRAVQRLLHDRTSRSIARALAAIPGVEFVVVPYHLGTTEHSRTADGPPDRYATFAQGPLEVAGTAPSADVSPGPTR
jgi:amino acid transporter